MDKLSGAVDNKLNQQAQPGDGVERAADGDANQGLSFHSTLKAFHPLFFPISRRK
jgi:hypothetical protein